MDRYFKKVFYLLLSGLIGMQEAHAQSGIQADESRNFVLFHSDSILYAERVRLRPDMFNELVLRADTKRIPLRNVKFFNSDDGFFATMRRLPGLGNEQLAERVIEGRINIFMERPYQYRDYRRPYRSKQRYRNNDSGVNLRMYFNKGYDDLKKVNYRNLNSAMADDPESIDLLRGYRQSINSSKALYAAAGASITAALVSFLVSANRDKVDFDLQNGFSSEPQMPNFTASYILLGAGAGFAIGGYAVHFRGLRKLEAAVDHYNR